MDNKSLETNLLIYGGPESYDCVTRRQILVLHGQKRRLVLEPVNGIEEESSKLLHVFVLTREDRHRVVNGARKERTIDRFQLDSVREARFRGKQRIVRKDGKGRDCTSDLHCWNGDLRGCETKFLSRTNE